MWRSFLSSDEGIRGLAWILERRPPLTEKTWQIAAGFERFNECIQEILNTGVASKDDDDKEDKLKV
jgi:hypothetical protein